MATKLKNLKIRKVDFVDDGANPDAHIGVIKNKNGAQPAADGGDKGFGVIRRMLSFVGKAAGISQDEIDSAVDRIRKDGSASFHEKISEAQNRKICDEIWDMCYALQSSFCSIINDDGVDGASASEAMQKSLDEFQAAMQSCIEQWSSGKAAEIEKKGGAVTEADLKLMKSAAERLAAEIEKAAPRGAGESEKPKGEEEMKIDKSKMTDAERACLEILEKKYGIREGGGEPEGEPQPTAGAPADGAGKSSGAGTHKEGTPDDGGGNDIYKGINPAVKAELEALKKFREAAEDKEMREVAKRYEIIGKKADELAPVLKSLKAAGGTAYNDMIAVLDQAVDVMEKSGVFGEIGKAGHSTGENSAEAKAAAIAKGYMEKDPSLDYATAVAKAWEDNPGLIAEYDEQEGF